ncbi:MAG: MarR family transcriptional regulator [Flavobacteriales bacterium]|nr:MarR family transcriptional regulator [Flavobacteriales bacterium]
MDNEHSLGYWCSRIGQQYFLLLSDRLRHLGLDRWYYAIVVISEAEGRISQQELADALQQDKVTMTRAIDHLCERGFVMRDACPNDRRKHHLKLLPKAEAAVIEIKAAYAAINRIALKGHSAPERRQLVEQLRHTLGNLHEAADKIPSAKKKQRPS